MLVDLCHTAYEGESIRPNLKGYKVIINCPEMYEESILAVWLGSVSDFNSNHS